MKLTIIPLRLVLWQWIAAQGEEVAASWFIYLDYAYILTKNGEYRTVYILLISEQ